MELLQQKLNYLQGKIRSIELSGHLDFAWQKIDLAAQQNEIHRNE